MFPNEFDPDDTLFNIVFYNALSYPIDFYGYDMEGRKHDISSKVNGGIETNKRTSLTTPWVFLKYSNRSKRLFAFFKNESRFIFKGKDYDVEKNKDNHVIINDNGKLSRTALRNSFGYYQIQDIIIGYLYS